MHLRIANISFTDTQIVVCLSDGRVLSLPLAWYPRLENALPQQRANWRLLGQGVGVHWPDIDEDLSLEGFQEGRPAPGSAEYVRRTRGRGIYADRYSEGTNMRLLKPELAEHLRDDQAVNDALEEYLKRKPEET